MAKRLSKKRSSLKLDAEFQGLLNGFLAASANQSRVLKLGNLGRSGGLTQLNGASTLANNATTALLVFVTAHPEYLEAYRAAVANQRF